MRGFERADGVLTAVFEPYEIELVTSLTEQLQEILGGEEPVSDDPFVLWQAQAQRAGVLDHADPVINRLFPDAYEDDAAAAAEFRRFTEEEARQTRVANARVVLDDLAGLDEGRRPLLLPDDHVQAWLKTLNALRLSLSSRLEIADEHDIAALEALPDEDPRSFLYAWYEWFGWVLESLLEAL